VVARRIVISAKGSGAIWMLVGVAGDRAGSRLVATSFAEVPSVWLEEPRVPAATPLPERVGLPVPLA
jgi:hypothetical protein